MTRGQLPGWDGRPATGASALATSLDVTLASTTITTTTTGYGAQLSFTSRGPGDKFLINATGELFQSSTSYAIWRAILLDGSILRQVVGHWISPNAWHDWSITKIAGGLAAGTHTIQLGLSAEANANVNGDWTLSVMRAA